MVRKRTARRNTQLNFTMNCKSCNIAAPQYMEALRLDAGRDYVSKKSVKPIAEALEWCCRRMDHGNELDGQCIEKAQHARKMIQSLGLLYPSPQKPVDT